MRTVIIERWSLLRRVVPTDFYVVVKAVLLAAVAIQLARLVWVVVTPVGPLGEWRPAPARLLAPSAQAAIIAAVDPFFRRGNVAAEALPNLDLLVFGTRSDQATGNGSAIIGAADGEQKSYMVGEEIVPGVTLASVLFDHVVLDRGGGRQQKLFVDQSQQGAPPAAAGPLTSGAPAAQGTAATFQQAVQFAPRVQNGRVTGVAVAAKGDPSLFASAGFRPGDVIVAVNGARITSQTDIVQLQSSIAPGARLSLSIERGAETVPVALNLAGN